MAPDLDQRVPHPGSGLHRRARARRSRSRTASPTSRPRWRPASRSTTSRRGSRSSSTATSTSSRRSASSAPRAGSGPAGCATCTAPTDERSLRLRFHAQTSGASLTAQQPENNVARVALQGLAAVLGGAQSLHTDSFDEALALPSDKAARIALRTQQIIADETGVALVADPLGGSAYVEWMTDELERQAEEVFSQAARRGRRVDARRRVRGHRRRLVRRRDRRRGLPLRIRHLVGHAARRGRERRDRRRRRRPAHALHRARGRGAAAEAARDGEGAPEQRRRRRLRSPASSPTPATPP